MKRIATFLHYGYELFAKHLFMSLFLILELVLSVIAVNFSVSLIRGMYADVDMIRSAGENTLVVMPSRELMQGNSKLDLTNLGGSYTAGEGYTSSLNISGYSYKLIGYNDALLSGISIPLAKGSWNAEAIREGDNICYPVLISRESTLKFNDRFLALTNSGETVSCYVAGVLEEHQRYITLSFGSSKATAQQLVHKCTEEILLFVNTAHFPSETCFYQFSGNSFLLFFNGVSAEEMEFNKQVLRNCGFVFTRDEILTNSMDSIHTNVRYYLPLCFGILIISIAGLFSAALLSFYRNNIFYRTAMLCGAKRTDCILIGFADFIWTMLISLGILCVLYATFLHTGIIGQLDLELSGLNLLTTGAIYGLLLVFGFVLPLTFFNKAKTRQILLRYDIS